jgi:hypothetical protein
MRRVGPDIELRFVEAFGLRGTAEIALRLPHTAAALTDMTGGCRVPLAPAGRYRVPVRPQQIVTMRFRTSGSVEEPKPRTEWDDLAPEHKRAALREYSEEKGASPARRVSCPGAPTSQTGSWVACHEIPHPMLYYRRTAESCFGIMKVRGKQSAV